jgi:hypothetical protein
LRKIAQRSRARLALCISDDKEGQMIESTPESTETFEQLFEKHVRPLVIEARKHPPRFGHIAPPIDIADMMAHCTGGLYEGFEEDVKRMRHGQPALGPRE